MAGDSLSGVQQKEVSIGDLEFKMPFIARDARIMGAVFPAPVKKLLKLLPGKDFHPAQMLPGMGLLQLTAYEYRDTDLGPFNELSVVIPLYTPRFPKIPFYNLSKTKAAREMHNFLLHRAANNELTVSMAKNCLYWPEFLASIEFTESDDWLTCEVKESGDLICRLRGRKIPAQNSDPLKFFIYTPQHHQPQIADSQLEKYKTTFKSSSAELTLGSSHPIAKEISETLGSVKPRMYTYAPIWKLIAYGPE